MLKPLIFIYIYFAGIFTLDFIHPQLATASCIGDISSLEYEAVQALYFATNGDYWNLRVKDNYSSPWIFPSNLSAPCGNLTWEGLTCNQTTAGECFISRISLFATNLRGTLPSILGNLSTLEIIDFDSNLLSGTIPESFGGLKQIHQLSLYYNSLSGTIPVSLFKLPTIEKFILEFNLFSGSFPTQMGEMSSVLEIYVNNNFFTNTLPSTIGNLRKLFLFGANNNYMTGSISSRIADCPLLSTLFLYYNYFTGQIPSQLSRLRLLQTCFLYSNLLSQTIPSELGDLHGLIQLGLNNNCLSGTLPSTFGNLSRVEQMYLHSNLLTGSIPSELGVLPVVSTIDISYNKFTGTIPDVLWRLSRIQYFFLDSNSLIGSISSEIGYMVSLISIELADNSFTGTIPIEIYTLTRLNEIIMSDNCFTGSIHTNITNLESLQILNMSNNYFSGYLFDELSELVKMRTFSIARNFITGSIPSALQHCVVTQALNFAYNFLQGSLPSELKNLRFLTSFNISNNQITGSLTDLFASDSALYRLVYFDVSQNALTGQIPPGMFESEYNASLEMVALYSNCFEGTLPSSICLSASMRILILDSASSAPACEVQFPISLRNIFRVQIGKHQLSGDIPSCLWSMPTLTTLHLSGNGLQGTLGELREGASSLNDVSLASNELVGSIPSSWQSWKWLSLDVSRNKLSGTLREDFYMIENQTAIDLTVNRLSGSIPPTFYRAETVNILDGNLFQCTSQTKPINDPSSSEYVCGSDNFDDALIFWIVLVGGVAVSVLFYKWQGVGRSAGTVLARLNPFTASKEILLQIPADNKCLVQYIELHRQVAKTSVALLAVFYTALVAYVSIKSTSSSLAATMSTHSFQYTWQTTAAYLHSLFPALLVIFCLFVGVGLVGLLLEIKVSIISSKARAIVNKAIGLEFHIGVAFLILSITVVHFVVTVAVNVLYVFALIKGLSAQALLTIQLLLSIFKLVWNKLFISWSLMKLPINVESLLTFSTFLSLFTFIASPIIATFFSDNTCFRYVITGQPVVTSAFSVETFECHLFCNPFCHVLCGLSSDPQTVLTSVTPSWTYSFECSSSLLVNYTPVLLYSYGISGLLVPSCIFLYVSVLSKTSYGRIQFLRRMAQQTLLMHQLDPDLLSNGSKPRKPFAPIAMLTKIFMNIGVLLSFGLASPLLAAAVCLDSTSEFVLWLYLVQRYVRLHTDCDQSEKELGSLPEPAEMGNNAWRRINDCVAHHTIGKYWAVWIIIVMISIFWSLFVFDMVGDDYGISAGGFFVFLPTVGTYLVLAFVGCILDIKNPTSNLLSASSSIMDIRLTDLNGDFEFTDMTSK